MSLTDKNYSVGSREGMTDSIMRIPEAIVGEMGDLFSKCQKGKPSAKEKVLKLIKKYPNAPMVKQLLVTWYEANDQQSAAIRVNDELLRSFPDFVFAHTRKLARLLDNGEMDAAGEILGENFDIGHHFPNRKVFDITEYNAFIANVVQYLAYNSRFAEAEAQIALLSEVEGEEEFADELSQIVAIHRLEKKKESMRDDTDITEANQVTECTLPQRNVAVMPAAQEFEFLYNGQWEVDTFLLEQSMVHQKDALIAELRHIIHSSIEGFEYCYEEGIWSAAVLHALLILPYTDDESTFIDALQIFRQPESYVDYWIIDWGEELIHPYFKTFSESKLQAVKVLLIESPGNTSSKVTLAGMLAQFVVYSPHSRDAVIQCIREIFEWFIACGDGELIDEEVIGFIISAAVDIHATELMGVIRELYARGWVSEFMEGSPEECEESMHKDVTVYEYQVYENVSEHLAALIPMTVDKEDDDIDEAGADKLKFDFDKILKAINEKKEVVVHQITPHIDKNVFGNVSKNALCPCGSGKKYKRCHGL